jgi:hypothetical protein
MVGVLLRQTASAGLSGRTAELGKEEANRHVPMA